MLDLDKIDYYELFKKILIQPNFDSLERNYGRHLVHHTYEVDNNVGKIYYRSSTTSNKITEEYILNGETNFVNFSSENIVSPQMWFKNVLKIYYYKEEPHIIHVKLASRKLRDDNRLTAKHEKLHFTKSYSLRIKFDILKKQFQFQVKFEGKTDRITYLSFNTACYIKPFIHPATINEFAPFLLKANSNEFILNSPAMDFVNSVFDNNGDNYIYFHVPNDKLASITNPTTLYKYITKYKNLNKNILKYSLKTATMISHYIEEKDQQKFFQILNSNDHNEFNSPVIKSVQRKDHLEIFVKYYYWKIYKPKNDRPDWDLIYDYILISKQLDTKLNLDINSHRRLKEEHDRLEKLQRAMKIPEFKTHEHYKNALSSNSTVIVELIDDRVRLAEESDIMNHCVYSYHDRINDGSCAIYSIKNKANEKERWTLELRVEDIRDRVVYESDTILKIEKQYCYRIGQLRTYNNVSAPKWVWNEIENMLAQHDSV